jgi:Flp pilus assembly protein TadD
MRATELLREHLNVNNDDAPRLGHLAICHAKLKRNEDALSTIERAVTLEPRNTTLMYQQAVVHALVGDFEQAIHHLTRALSHGYSRPDAEHDPDLDTLRDRPEFQSLFTNGT